MQLAQFDLTGRRALVTGATRGIGRALAIGLAAAGADLVAVQRGDASETLAEIRALGREASQVSYDLADVAGISRLVAEIEQAHGSIDVLVNNACVTYREPAESFAFEHWQHVIDVGLSAPFKLAQEIGTRMLARGRGKIINIASLTSFQSRVGIAAYTAAKGGIAQLTKALANEWAGRGVNVNAIAPGYIATELNAVLRADAESNRSVVERIPAGRWGRPEDLVGTAVFLAASASDYVHGHVLAVDGGWLAR